jgi:hypothetical protein
MDMSALVLLSPGAQIFMERGFETSIVHFTHSLLQIVSECEYKIETVHVKNCI